jgi:hypothetical protein
VIHPLIDQAFFAARALNLAWLLAFALLCQFLAIVYFVEKLKGVELGVAEASNKEARTTRARLERHHRAAYGLCIDLSLYLLAVEVVLVFVVLTR